MYNFFTYYFVIEPLWWIPCTFIIASQLPLPRRCVPIGSLGMFTLGWYITLFHCIGIIFRSFQTMDIRNHTAWYYDLYAQELTSALLMSLILSMPAIFIFKWEAAKHTQKGLKYIILSFIMSLTSILLILTLINSVVNYCTIR
jgi:hypothetical protein